MLAMGIIEKSYSPWASHIVPIKKKDGSTRICVDYRELNKVTKRDAYDSPKADLFLEVLAGKTVFSTLDLQQGFHQIPLSEKSKEKTAFRSGLPGGELFQYTKMPFGLMNAPMTFQRCMDRVFQGTTHHFVLVYIDDILVFSENEEDHLQHLKIVFNILKEKGFRLKAKKCALFQKSVTFLGHILSADGMVPDPEKVAPVKDCPVPKCQKDVRRFV